MDGIDPFTLYKSLEKLQVLLIYDIYYDTGKCHR